MITLYRGAWSEVNTENSEHPPSEQSASVSVSVSVVSMQRTRIFHMTFTMTLRSRFLMTSSLYSVMTCVQPVMGVGLVCLMIVYMSTVAQEMNPGVI